MNHTMTLRSSAHILTYGRSSHTIAHDTAKLLDARLVAADPRRTDLLCRIVHDVSLSIHPAFSNNLATSFRPRGTNRPWGMSLSWLTKSSRSECRFGHKAFCDPRMPRRTI